MEGNVFGWSDIIDSGTDLTGYAWQKEQVPVGEFEAVLDFKVWSKNVAGINCYFRLLETDQLIKLTLFRMKDESYKLTLDGIDFKNCPIGVPYKIEIGLNGKGNIAFRNCRMISDH